MMGFSFLFEFFVYLRHCNLILNTECQILQAFIIILKEGISKVEVLSFHQNDIQAQKIHVLFPFLRLT